MTPHTPPPAETPLAPAVRALHLHMADHLVTVLRAFNRTEGEAPTPEARLAAWPRVWDNSGAEQPSSDLTPCAHVRLAALYVMTQLTGDPDRAEQLLIEACDNDASTADVLAGLTEVWADEARAAMDGAE